MRKSISPEEAERRLRVIFPRAAFDSVLSSPQAGMAIATFIYVGAVCDMHDEPTEVFWLRPSTVNWMSREVLLRHADPDRLAWRTAAAKDSKHVEALYVEWGIPSRPAYKDTSREPLRDETFRGWREHGALRLRPGLATSSPLGRWALLSDFADLFDPDLTDELFEEAANLWREKHLDPGTRLKAKFALDTEAATHAVTVTLPDGTTRTLEPGPSSPIIKGVIETWAPARLTEPVVLAISEPGDKVHAGDMKILRALGISIDLANVLPDVVIADIGTDPVHFWIIEAVATDGVVTNQRRKSLLAWAAKQNIKADRCSFLTAFLSRNHTAAKKRLKDIASGTWAWFADEPGHELAWYQVIPTADDS